MGSTWTFLWGCAAFASSLLRFSFCSASLTCLTLALLLGVSALVSALLGVEGPWFGFWGLILLWVPVSGLRRRLDLRGLLSAGDSGRSARSFLRGVRLMKASAAASTCFLLGGADTSWGKQTQYEVWNAALKQLDPIKNEYWCSSYGVVVVLSLSFIVRVLLRFRQRAQILLSQNFHLQIPTCGKMTIMAAESVYLSELTLHLVKSATELGPNLTCLRAALTKFSSREDSFSAETGSGRLKLLSQTAII